MLGHWFPSWNPRLLFVHHLLWWLLQMWTPDPFCRWIMKQKAEESSNVNVEVNNTAEQKEADTQEVYDDAESVMAHNDEITISLPVPPSYCYSKVYMIPILPAAEGRGTQKQLDWLVLHTCIVLLLSVNRKAKFAWDTETSVFLCWVSGSAGFEKEQKAGESRQYTVRGHGWSRTPHNANLRWGVRTQSFCDPPPPALQIQSTEHVRKHQGHELSWVSQEKAKSRKDKEHQLWRWRQQ